jgi:hypothetical protein
MESALVLTVTMPLDHVKYCRPIAAGKRGALKSIVLPRRCRFYALHETYRILRLCFTRLSMYNINNYNNNILYFNVAWNNM